MNLKQIRLCAAGMEALEAINREAFPQNEYVPLEKLLALNPELQVDLWAMMEEDKPSGFTVIMKSGACAYIWYLAVSSRSRGSGLGSQTLTMLPELYPDCQVVVDFEAILPDAPNNAQRIRRTGFYKRNGFHMTTMRLHYMQDEFVAAWKGKGESFDRDGFMAVLNELHKLVPDFDPWFDDKPIVDGQEDNKQ